ncbi:hypothetical protein L873DRAFT_1048152 [Choiromyces venosus 120613-1]|uniref:Uncharacterized protein n=1 Tax=Choiromyces venosus 120613-1 TaxID=1336337 RepID=A0A3N4JJ36_9PEZI|nr:hypothetical protein L873DRAFT_1048152 [Choiromyces venosus 120613-1]
MPDLEDNISELSSLSAYPGSPATSSQILLDDQSDISHFNLDDEDDDVNCIMSSWSPSQVLTLIPQKKTKTVNTVLMGMGQTRTASWALGRNQWYY